MNPIHKLHKLLLAAAAAAFALLAQAQSQGSQPQTVKLSVNGMVCAFCAQGIEKRLSRMPETGPLYINLAKKVVAIEPKPGQSIDVAKVKAEIADAGYDVTQVETVPQTVATIKAEMKSRK